MSPIAKISAELIPIGLTEWSIHREKIPLRLGKATVTRDETSIVIHGKVAGVVDAELTIAVDPSDPEQVTATVSRHEFKGALAQEKNAIIFRCEQGKVSLRAEKKRLYVHVEGFGTSGVGSYYLAR